MEWVRADSGHGILHIFENETRTNIVSIIPARDGLYHLILDGEIPRRQIAKVMFINEGQIIKELGFNPWKDYI